MTPDWMNDVIATPRGFVNKAGKLVKAQRMTAKQCDEFNSRTKEPEVETNPEPKTIVLEIKDETPIGGGEEIQVKEEPKVVYLSESELKKLSKAKLEEYGRSIGVELDRRQTKANMIKSLLSAISNK